MDIDGPTPEEEVCPDPKTDAERNVDKPALVREMIQENPGLTSDEIVELLAARGVQVSGILVARELVEMKKQQPHIS